jgi:hypothetical protein
LQKANLLWGGGGGGSEKTTTSVGGGGGTTNGGSGGQGLAHWMSVMAEHMNHETTPLHPAYMWNGVEVKFLKEGRSHEIWELPHHG